MLPWRRLMRFPELGQHKHPVLALTATAKILAESSKAMVLIDGDTLEIVQANPVAEAFWGQIVGAKLDLLIPAAGREDHRKLVAAYMVHPVARPIRNVTTVLADGREVAVEIGLTPMPGTRLILADIEPA